MHESSGAGVASGAAPARTISTVMKLPTLLLGNAAIAAELGLSVRTVERHLSNAYGKLGVAGKAARAAAVAAVLRRGLA